MQFLLTLQPLTDVELLLRLGFAVLIGGMIGMEREYKNRPAGMRTHILVCLGAASIALLESMLQANLLAHSPSVESISLSLGRLSAQVISGIGFLGAGTIILSQKKIAGLTTSASIWTMACLGLLIGFGFYYLALIITVIMILVLSFLQRIIRVNALKKVEIRFIHRNETIAFLNGYFIKNGIRVLDVDFHIESHASPATLPYNIYTNVYSLRLSHKIDYSDIVNHLSEHPNIQMVRTRNV